MLLNFLVQPVFKFWNLTKICILYQALPFALENLLEPELKEMKELMEKEQGVREQLPAGLSDPCPKFCQIMVDFVSWFFKARARKHTESSILDVARLGNRLQNQLKEAFPNRAGTSCCKFILNCFLVYNSFIFGCRIIALLVYPEIPCDSACSSLASHVWFLGERFYSGNSILV